ncbi:MAG TPA: hypothetical protein PLA68_12555 [Panacibacter sp.]|nr:hypothetical protein [Panacibacter sp.]
MKLDTRAKTYGLDDSLIIPIAAKSKEMISDYIGDIEYVFRDDKAFIVSFAPLKQPGNLPVWQHPRSYILNHPKQLWVHIKSTAYRKYYYEAFKESNLETKCVVDHIMNRKLAEKFGYNFVRLIHIDRGVNSDSGRGGETFANENYLITSMLNPDVNINGIEYADPSDLLKMLNIKTGGKYIDNVGKHHYLFY